MPLKNVSLTVTADRKMNVIITPVEIKISEQESKIQTHGIWDTGASGSAITKDVAQKLGLKPTGLVNVSGVHGSKTVNTYIVDLSFMGRINILKVKVTECEKLIGDHVGMLIGMDIINLGEMAISNFEGKTTFTFRVPPTKKIDFAREDNARIAVENKYKKKK